MITAVLCDGATAPTALKKAAGRVLELNSSERSGVANIRIPALDVKLRGAVPTVAVDLLRIAAFVYWADQMVPRPIDVDVEGEYWKRTFAICIPVSEPDLWRDEAVDRALTRALSYGTDDDWIFHFVGSGPTGPGYLLPAGIDSVSGADSVLLFSGGTDSFTVAALEAERGRHPLLLSHGASTRVRPKQAALREALVGREWGWNFPHRFVEITKRAVEEKERTQRARGFLYSAMGAAVARCFDLRDVVLADNGFVSVGLPLNGQTVGARMSRTTHPHFQRLFNRLCDLVVPGVRLRNPLLFETRSEGLRTLQRMDLHRFLASSQSCTAGGRLPRHEGHCGVCSQCLDRRIGVVAAGLQAHDAQYKNDTFYVELKGDSLTLGESYVRLMRQLMVLTADQMVVEFPQLLDCVSRDPSEVDVLPRVIEMLRRQAEAATEAIQTMTEPILTRLLGGDFPTTSLVRLWLEGTPTRKRKGWKAPVVEEVELSPAEEAVFKRERFKSRVPIHVTGERPRPRSNIVELGGLPHRFPDADFILFLRLIVALWETGNGYVLKGGGAATGGIADEPGIVPGGVDQAIDRLRSRVQLGSGSTGMNDIIEVNNKRVRLSTHRRFIRFDHQALLEHDRETVRELASRLPFTGN